MIVLLPPSETKATRKRGKPLDLAELSLPELREARNQVLEALDAVSHRDDISKILGVSPNLTEDLQRNTRLRTAPTLPASEMYSGVLFDALDFASLSSGDKTRARNRIIISSGLYGAVRLADRLAPYRLSMAVNLPGVGSLSSHWKQHLQAPLDSLTRGQVVVDGRSSTYASSWTPNPDLVAAWVHIRVPGATHMAKHTRGLVARRLVQAPRAPKTVKGLMAILEDTFEMQLHEPRSAKAPFILDATARAAE